MSVVSIRLCLRPVFVNPRFFLPLPISLTHGPLPVVRPLDWAARGQAPHITAVPRPDVDAAEEDALERGEDLCVAGGGCGCVDACVGLADY